MVSRFSLSRSASRAAARGRPPLLRGPRRRSRRGSAGGRSTATGGRLVFRVESLSVDKDGWRASIGVRNDSKERFLVGLRAPRRSTRRSGSCCSRRPAQSSTAEQGRRPAGRPAGGGLRAAAARCARARRRVARHDSAHGSLPGGSWARIVFGVFVAAVEPPKGNGGDRDLDHRPRAPARPALRARRSAREGREVRVAGSHLPVAGPSSSGGGGARAPRRGGPRAPRSRRGRRGSWRRRRSAPRPRRGCGALLVAARPVKPEARRSTSQRRWISSRRRSSAIGSGWSSTRRSVTRSTPSPALVARRHARRSRPPTAGRGVAARRLACLERGDEPLGERAGRLAVRAGHLRDDLPPARMLPCTAKPGPVSWPAQALQSEPV